LIPAFWRRAQRTKFYLVSPAAAVDLCGAASPLAWIGTPVTQTTQLYVKQHDEDTDARHIAEIHETIWVFVVERDG
jgi:hypothetical protein